MRKDTWVFVCLVGVLAAVGCTTTDDKPGTGGAGGGAAGAPYTPEPNGVPMDEQEACAALRSAFDEHASRLGCTYTLPLCPEYIRKSGAPTCSQYDEGSILGCADFYATFTSCSEFEQRPCQIYNIEDSAPNGCPEEVDAGADAEADAEADAQGDAEVEAGEDAEADVAAEAEAQDAAGE